MAVAVMAPQGDEFVQRWCEFGEMLRGRFTRIDDQLVELRGDVTELKTDVAELKTDMVVVKRDVAELKTDVTELKGQVGRLEESNRLGFQRVEANFEQLRHLIARDERRNPDSGAGKAPRPRKQ